MHLRAGVATLATQTACPLYLSDARKRFCLASPYYGLAYREPDPKCRFAFVVPMIFGESGDSFFTDDKVVGAIAFESIRKSAIRPEIASFAATLLRLACEKFPRAPFENSVSIL